MSCKGFNDYQTLGEGGVFDHKHPRRSIPQRVDMYGLMNYMGKKSSVLDIGCNRGLFGIHLSDKVREYVGVEHDLKQLSFGMAEAKKRGLKNVRYQNCGFESYSAGRRFDVILSLAVYGYIKMTIPLLARKLDALLNHGGYIIQECHPVSDVDAHEKIHELIPIIELDYRMERIFHTVFDDLIWEGKKRDFYVWKKP